MSTAEENIIYKEAIERKHKELNLDIKIGTSAIVRIARDLDLYRTKKKKIKKCYDKNEYTENIKNSREIVQIDIKYAGIFDGWVYQMTSTDLATKTTWTQIYENKTTVRGLFIFIIF